MKDIIEIFSLRPKKTLRLGILLLSTILIAAMSALVYDGMLYEKTLNVGGVGGATPSPGPTPPLEPGITLAIVILGLSAIIMSVSVFRFLREASKHFAKSPGDKAVRTESAPDSQEEGWEESPTKGDREK